MQPTGFEPVPLARMAPKATALTTRPKLRMYDHGTKRLQKISPYRGSNPESPAP